jgi:hypothetical protein
MKNRKLGVHCKDLKPDRSFFIILQPTRRNILPFSMIEERMAWRADYCLRGAAMTGAGEISLCDIVSIVLLCGLGCLIIYLSLIALEWLLQTRRSVETTGHDEGLFQIDRVHRGNATEFVEAPAQPVEVKMIDAARAGEFL